MTLKVQGQNNTYVSGRSRFSGWCYCMLLLAAGLFLVMACAGGVKAATVPGDPVIARYDGGEITLGELEIYAREMPLAQRIPFARGAGEWRRLMSGQLAKMTALTSQAKTMGLHMDPAYLRARDYFINEYLAYLVIREKVKNRMDFSPALQAKEYETYKQDFYLSPTVSLRMIRTRDRAQITSAAKALGNGADFVEVENQVSQVSPRYRGKVIGPFPSREEKAVIPPPPAVIAAAIAQDEKQTTGPIEINGFYYLIKTEEKTPGRLQSQQEVAEQVLERLGQDQARTLIPELIDTMQRELAVEVDEALFASASTNPADVLATVGTLRITRQEYTDLNGSVRGPASPIAANMPTKLKGFILPYMFGEWARANGYQELPETVRALYYYDLQHLSARVVMELGNQVMPLPTDDELRARFQQNIDSYRQPGQPEPRFEDHKQSMMDIILQGRADEVEARVTAMVLSKLNFQMVPGPVCSRITALEAVVSAQDRLASGVRLLEIRSADGQGEVTPYPWIGRSTAWSMTVAADDDTTSSFQVEGPARLVQDASDYAGIAAMTKWAPLWRFDTDSLKRYSLDHELGDFLAKYNNDVRVEARVEFAYSADDPTSPTKCAINYRAIPLEQPTADGFEVEFDGYSGEVVQRSFGKSD